MTCFLFTSFQVKFLDKIKKVPRQVTLRHLCFCALFLAVIAFFVIEGIVKTSAPETPERLFAVILSNNYTRFKHSRRILKRNEVFEVRRKMPISYKSPVIDGALNELNLNVTDIMSSFNMTITQVKKTLSNELTFIEALRAFSAEPSDVSKVNDWTFFFEDDIALHSSVTDPIVAIRRGILHAREDGILYLGICGPTCNGWANPFQAVKIKRCYGSCAHAFGLAKWKVESFLQSVDILKGNMTDLHKLYFDRFLYAYGQKVKPVHVLDWNLASPCNKHHKGIYYQDRSKFASAIDN